MNREQISEVLNDRFAANPAVTAVYLFGSIATGRARPASDVDVGVLYRRALPQTLLGQPFGVEASLAEALGRRVQLVVMNDAPPDLIHRILRDGLLIVERDRNERVAFEVRSRNAYFDLLPILTEYRSPQRSS